MLKRCSGDGNSNGLPEDDAGRVSRAAHPHNSHRPCVEQSVRPCFQIQRPYRYHRSVVSSVRGAILGLEKIVSPLADGWE